jgi:hypothetical protein
MMQLHFSDISVPAVIFICGAWISVEQTMEKGFYFIGIALFVYLVFLIALMGIRGQL